MNSVKELIAPYSRNKGTTIAHSATPAQIKAIADHYKESIPSDVMHLFDATAGGFLDIHQGDGLTFLSPEEILTAQERLKVDFKTFRVLPLIDCKDKIYLCYNFKTEKFFMFDVGDEFPFDENESMTELLQKQISYRLPETHEDKDIL